jgi:hypothetical protein
MSLLEQQNLLARLYMDEDLRRDFLSDPAGTAAPFGLSGAEIEDLKLVLPDELGSFADSLFRKRLREVERMIPLSRKVLDERFEPLFAEYIKATPSASEIKRVDDVLEFCSYVLREAAGDTRETVNFERARIAFQAGKRNFVFVRYQRKFHILMRFGKRVMRRSFG